MLTTFQFLRFITINRTTYCKLRLKIASCHVINLINMLFGLLCFPWNTSHLASVLLVDRQYLGRMMTWVSHWRGQDEVFVGDHMHTACCSQHNIQFLQIGIYQKDTVSLLFSATFSSSTTVCLERHFKGGGESKAGSWALVIQAPLQSNLPSHQELAYCFWCSGS